MLRGIKSPVLSARTACSRLIIITVMLFTQSDMSSPATPRFIRSTSADSAIHYNYQRVGQIILEG